MLRDVALQVLAQFADLLPELLGIVALEVHPRLGESDQVALGDFGGQKIKRFGVHRFGGLGLLSSFHARFSLSRRRDHTNVGIAGAEARTSWYSARSRWASKALTGPAFKSRWASASISPASRL